MRSSGGRRFRLRFPATILVIIGRAGGALFAIPGRIGLRTRNALPRSAYIANVSGCSNECKRFGVN